MPSSREYMIMGNRFKNGTPKASREHCCLCEQRFNLSLVLQSKTERFRIRTFLCDSEIDFTIKIITRNSHSSPLYVNFVVRECNATENKVANSQILHTKMNWSIFDGQTAASPIFIFWYTLKHQRRQRQNHALLQRNLQSYVVEFYSAKTDWAIFKEILLDFHFDHIKRRLVHSLQWK